MATNLSETSIFNPSVKDESIPYYGGLSKPISDLKNYGTATSEALKGGAELFTDTVKVAHTLTQQSLDDKIHAKIDSVRDPYNQQLADALESVRGASKTVPADGGTVTRVDVKGNAIGPKGSLDLLSQPDPTQIPAGLENLTTNLTALGGAKANGKLSRTDYTARLDALAKDFRADYPGWREYIDKKFESITGENPANALIKERISDINSFVTAAKSEKDKILAVAMRPENLRIPDMPERIAIFQATGNSAALLKFINQNQRQHYNTELKEQELKETEATVKDKAIQATQISSKVVGQIVNNHVGTILESVGISTDPQKAEEAFANLDASSATQLANNLRNRIEFMSATARQKLNLPIPGDPNGNSKAFYMGPDAVNTLIDNHMKVVSRIADRLDNKQTGVAFQEARLTQSWADATENRVMGTTGIGELLRETKVFEKNVGPQALGTLLPGLISTQLPIQWNNYVTSRKVAAAIGKPEEDTGLPETLKGDIFKARKIVMDDPDTPQPQKDVLIAKLNQEFLQQIQGIADPRLDEGTRRRYVERAFSEEGKGLIAQLERDGVGPAGKKGKFSVYNELTSERMTDAVKELGGKHWDMYKDWAQSTWSNELLKPEVRKLTADITRAINSEIGKMDVDLKWNDKDHKFGATFGELGQPAPGYRGITSRAAVSQAIQDQINDSIVRLNGTLSKYAYIAKKEGVDVNAYVAGALLQIIGQNPGEPTADAFIKAIEMTTRKIPKPSTRGEAP